MTSPPTRVGDAHVHIWDPARTDWYPYLAHPPKGGAGDASRMFRRFDVDTYRAETAQWNVEKFVNVAAATGPIMTSGLLHAKPGLLTGHMQLLPCSPTTRCSKKPFWGKTAFCKSCQKIMSIFR